MKLSQLNERFLNLIRNKDMKEKYKHEVWDLLQQAYAPIGGIKGNGFESVDSIVNIPFWKLVVRDGVVHAVVLYKDKEGRKSVAMGSDGSEYGKQRMLSIIKDDTLQGRAYTELSKGALATKMKLVPWDILESFMMTPQEVQQLSTKPIIPLDDYEDKLPDDAVSMIAKYPQLIPYGYLRKISGEYTFKVMMGTPHQYID